MSDRLDEVVTEAVSGLAHRVRPAQAGTEKAPCLLLLHGVGSNESGFIELARQMDARLVVILVRGPLVLAPGRFAWFQVSFTPSGPSIDAAQPKHRASSCSSSSASCRRSTMSTRSGYGSPASARAGS
jgi:phospholipase/carboxylesterase